MRKFKEIYTAISKTKVFWLAPILIIGVSIILIHIFQLSWWLMFFSISLSTLTSSTIVYFYLPKYQQKEYALFLRQKIILFQHETSGLEKLNFMPREHFPNYKHITELLFILSIILALVPTIHWEEWGILSCFDVMRKTMQMFIVDGGISEFIDFCELSAMMNCISKVADKTCVGIIITYNAYIALLSVVTGLNFAFSILGVFAKEFIAYFSYWLARPSFDTYVFSELNEKSVAIAENIFISQFLDKHSFKFYFCNVHMRDEKDFSNLISRAKALGSVVMKKDISELRVKLTGRSSTFYLIGTKEEENVNHAIHIYEETRKRKNYGPLMVYIFASQMESELIIDDIQNRICDTLYSCRKQN